MSTYDPFSTASKSDPQTYFGLLRTSCPVHHFALPDEVAARINANPLAAQPTREFWSLLRFDDCKTALLDPATFCSKHGPGPEWMLPLTEEGVLLFSDDPAHSRQRRLVVKAFTPRAVERIKPRIEQIANSLIDGFQAAGRVELMEAFAVPLTIRTIAGIVGVEEEHVNDFWRWGNAIVAAFGGSSDANDAALAALQELFGYVQGLVDRIRQGDCPNPDISEGVLAGLVRAEVDGHRLTDQEIQLATMQLVTAGFETTSTATASAIYLLCTHPSERERLRRHPDLIHAAVEEMLRYASPLEGLFRTTTTPIEVSGTTIPAESKVRIVYASANRDGAHFDDPDVFRIDREPDSLRTHLAFGQGSHYCLGAALARAELTIAVDTLLRRLPGLQLDPTQTPERATALTINGFRSLPITWDTATPAAVSDTPTTTTMEAHVS